MLDHLPQYIDPLHLVEKRAVLKGQIPISDFERLADILHSNAGSANIELVFSREGRLAVVTGRIEVTLALTCQNCLDAVSIVIDCAIKLAIVASIDQANNLPEAYEPLLFDGDDNLLLKDIIEDEILLYLPIFPKHEHRCFVSQTTDSGAATIFSEAESSEQTRQNPFSVLAHLKQTGDT